MNNKKLGTLTLSGLIIGPIFGSGLILLPPLLFNMLGKISLIVWILTLMMGFFFALVFGKLSSMYKGEAGVSLAVADALGKKYQLLTSWYLICATLFGPVAVMLVAAEFLKVYFPHIDLAILGFFVYFITYLLLCIKINFLGKIMLFVSYGVVLLFLLSSIYVLLNHLNMDFSVSALSTKNLGYSFLVAFWAVVGWEVVGNYSNEAKDKNSLQKAILISAIIFCCIYLLIVFAISFGDLEYQGNFKLQYLLKPIWGETTDLILLIISIILCCGTLILFVGATARLIASLKLSSYTSKRLQNNVPIGALNILSIVYLSLLVLAYENLISLADLAAIANSFFIANALIGLFSAIILFKKGFLKNCAIFLCLIFMTILFFSNIIILAIIFSSFGFVYFRK